MKTTAAFVLAGFLLTVSSFLRTADARLFTARLMAGDEETLLQAQPIDPTDSNVLADKDNELSFDSAARLAELADLYRGQGFFSSAEVIVKDLVEMRQRKLGADHPEIAAYLSSLADIYRAKQDYAKAEPIYLRSLAIREKSFGLNHPEVATSLRSLADFYREQHRYSEAQPLYARALAILEKVLGPDHPDVAAVRASYASLLAAPAPRLAKVREANMQVAPAMSAGHR